MHGLYPNDASLLDSVGRLMLLVPFLVLGVRNLSKQQIEDHVRRLGGNGCPQPRIVFWAGTTFEFFACALILFNWHPAVGAICLIVFTATASALMHRFWESTDMTKRSSQQNGLGSNLGVIGGLLLLLQNVR